MAFAIDETSHRPVSLEVTSDGRLKVDADVTAVVGTVELGATSLAALETINALGPLTDAALRASAVPVSVATDPTPVDSLGTALPLDFDYLAETYGYTGSDLTTVVKTKGANTWTQTLTYSAGVLVSASQWVKV